MTKIIDSNISKDAAYAQYDSAVKAVIDRALSKEETYTNVVADQLFYVAVRILRQDRECRSQPVFEGWCEEHIAYFEGHMASCREFMDKLLGKDEIE